MKTKTTLAALLLAAVMVTPSYGDEKFIAGAIDYFEWKERHQSPINTAKIKYFLGTVDSFISRTPLPQPISFPHTLSRKELHIMIAEYVVSHPESHDYIVPDLISIPLCMSF